MNVHWHNGGMRIVPRTDAEWAAVELLVRSIEWGPPPRSALWDNPPDVRLKLPGDDARVEGAGSPSETVIG